MEGTKIMDLPVFKKVKDNSDVYRSVRAKLRVDGCTRQNAENGVVFWSATGPDWFPDGMRVATLSIFAAHVSRCALGKSKGGDMKAKLNLLVYRIWHALKREEGQDLIEYALLVGLIALATVASLQPFGSILYNYYLYLHNALKPYFNG